MHIRFYAPSAFEPWDWRNPDDPGIGGSETAVVELSRRLALRGHDVTVYGTVRSDTVDDPVGPVHWRSKAAADFAAPGVWVICRAPGAIDRFPDDRAIRATQRRWLQCQDTIYSEAHGGAITEARVAAIDCVLALSPTHVDSLASIYPFLAATGKLILSSNGIKREAMDALAAVPRDPFRLIWASSPDRGLEATLKIFNRAREFEPRLNLRIAYGWDNIDKLIAQHGDRGPWVREKRAVMKHVGPGVTLLGRLGQRALWHEFLQAGLWVYCTAFTETSCITCMEAQALGAIPIFTPLWALASNVKYGIAIDGHNMDGLTQARYVSAILRLVRDPDLAERIRQPMMPWARRQHDWDRVVNQYERLAEVEAGCS